jgi:predicted amidophosphoribosyltransferase
MGFVEETMKCPECNHNTDFLLPRNFINHMEKHGWTSKQALIYYSGICPHCGKGVLNTENPTICASCGEWIGKPLPSKPLNKRKTVKKKRTK